ncbi:TetR/AcrR family transcriptional regulator [Methylobacterium sp.]|jgi:TetR/AcrR family transcriptional repressor of uid operon|uniref:TetR/AcrR family transcriptional regulator n=1 Tax=Methylobacterium sp. TaxID=409 RepID=UPI0025F1EBA1|nr:TetR/AcrR family transcriptional regulator [Methylobacterium sp.]MBY0259394.1 TetR/AcrR family transcriptional regulator [Methylobacterium sp.]
MASPVGTLIDARAGQAARREQILDAACACFVRNGFHRTTMQDLAREAGMTAGNFYHYFRSKEALVMGLVQREREGGALLVTQLQREGDRRGALFGVLEQYFGALTRDEAVLRLEIWSEGTRNPAIADLTEASETETRTWFEDTFAALATSPACDPAALYALLAPQMTGVVASRAILPDFDMAGAVAQIRALIEAGLDGRLPAILEAAPESHR